MRLDLDGEEAQDVFRQAHLALHLVQRLGRRVELDERVVGLPVLVDPVGEGLQSPVLDLADRSAIRFDDTLVVLYKGVDLLLGQILPGKKHMFVKSHCSLAFLRFSPGSRRLKPLRPLLTRPFDRRRAGKKGACRDGRERRHGRRKTLWLHSGRSFARPSVQPPAGTGRLRRHLQGFCREGKGAGFRRGVIGSRDNPTMRQRFARVCTACKRLVPGTGR